MSYNGKQIHFGDSRYEDYLMPNDRKRGENYRNRASKLRDKWANLTFSDKNKPNFWAYYLLW